MFTEKDIYSALDLIRRICENQTDCLDCPFYSDHRDECLVNNHNIYDTPCQWKLVPPPEPTNWRPFEI